MRWWVGTFAHWASRTVAVRSMSQGAPFWRLGSGFQVELRVEGPRLLVLEFLGSMADLVVVLVNPSV